MTYPDNGATRRSVILGATAYLVCAPAIVRVSSLMPVRALPLQLPNPERKVPRTMGEWYRLCFYQNLEQNLRAGRAVTYGPAGGKAIAVAEARQIVARARAQGWLRPLVGNE
jgi:hypothetical protein